MEYMLTAALETVCLQKLVGQNNSAFTVFKYKLEEEMVVTSGITVVCCRRIQSSIGSHCVIVYFNGYFIIFSYRSKAEILHGIGIRNLIFINIEFIIFLFLNRIRCKVNGNSLSGLNQYGIIQIGDYDSRFGLIQFHSVIHTCICQKRTHTIL